jgi:hypothetical protein
VKLSAVHDLIAPLHCGDLLTILESVNSGTRPSSACLILLDTIDASDTRIAAFSAALLAVLQVQVVLTCSGAPMSSFD